ncbi:MAG TPA: DUF1801 domain-containing protein [Cyclobacteriaceae bacterium]|nr:DUF1801 domain-containing protein [Cyclobacteriaceae bacterium]
MQSFKTVDEFISNAKQWKEELMQLREILRETELTEGIKWGAPIYTYKGKNVVGMAGFKSYVGLWFHQGVLLKDPKKKLINAQEGVTKALRQWRMASGKEIDARAIKAYVKEAIGHVEDGKKIKPLPRKKTAIPKELAAALKKNPAAGKAFKLLAPFKQREYSEYIAEAARPETKEKRIGKILPLVQKGMGLNDKYR